MKNKKFWNWAADDNDTERTLYLNGAIAGNDTWFEDEVTPQLFKSELNSGKGSVTVWIDSMGGDVFAAAEIYNALMEYPGHVTIKIGSIAASAASVIAMSGSEVYISPVGLMLIHNPSTFVGGDSEEMRRAAEMLDSVKESIISAYALKSNQPRLKLSRMMNEEHFMDANEALELGFVDGILYRERQAPTQGIAAVFNKLPDISRVTTCLHNTRLKVETNPEISNGVSAESLDKRLSLILH